MSDTGQEPEDSQLPTSPPSGDAPPPPPPAPPSTPPPPAPGLAPPGYSQAPQPGYASPPPPAGYAPPAPGGYDPAQPQPGYAPPSTSGGYDPSQQAHGQPGAGQQGYAQPPGMAPTGPTVGSGTNEDTNSAVIAHVLALVGGFELVGNVLFTGIYYAVSKDKTPFVRHHATEALNFSITMVVGLLVSGVTCVGLVLWPIILVWSIVMPIIGAMAANKGEWYKYPAIFRLIKGPLDQPAAAQGYTGEGQGSGGQGF